MEANQMRARFLLGKEASRLANRTFNDREIQDFLNKAQLELLKKRYAAWKNRPQIGYGQNEVRDSELAGLITATQSVPRANFILGTELNGALQGPDLDNGGVTQDEDRFGVFVGLPDEALYLLAETCAVEKDTIQKRNTPVKDMNITKYLDGIYDPYAQPYDNLVWSFDWGSFTTSVPSGGTYDDSVKEYSSEGTGFNMQGLNHLGAAITIDTNRAKYLIPGKGWKITKYLVHYIKTPRDIHIDVQTPSLQVNCELAGYMHQEIVDEAVRLASAAVIPDPNQYQINQVESKEDE